MTKPTDELDEILEIVEGYTIQSALGGTPFKSEEENTADNELALTNGRSEAKAAIQALINKARIDELQHVDGAPICFREIGGEIVKQPIDHRIAELKATQGEQS